MKYKSPERQPISGCLSFLKENAIVLLGIMIVVFLCMHGLFSIYGFSAFPDEFGYWAPAASVLGYDWSNVTSLGSYYSYGYSLILVPILFLFHNSVSAYRFAILVNMLLQCASLPIMYRIVTFLFPNIKKDISRIVAVISILYPSWVYYTQMTMVEGLLNFLFVSYIYLLIRFIEKKTVIRAICIVIISIFMYVVHMRCIGIIISTFLFFMILLLRNTRNVFIKMKSIAIATTVMLVLFMGTFLLKDVIIGKLYERVPDSVLSWNDYSGILYRLSKLFSIEGLTRLFKEICGKMYYLGCATYGLGYFGIMGLFAASWDTVRHFKEKKDSNIFIVKSAVFLTCLMQFLVALVYLIGASDSDNKRLDLFLHGRYIDFFLPILIAVGILELGTCKKIVKRSVIIVIMHVLFMAVSYIVIRDNDTHMSSGHGFTMVGMSHFWEKGADALPYFFKESILMGIVLVGVFALVRLYCHNGKSIWLCIIIPIQAVFALNVCDHFVFYNQDNIYGDVLLGQMLEDVMEVNAGKELLHIYEGGAQYIEIVQFVDRDRNIEIIDGTGKKVSADRYLNQNTVLIVDMDGPISAVADEYYKNNITVGHLILFY